MSKNKDSKKIYFKKWTKDQLTEAVTIANQIGYHRASEQTGIPFSTLRHFARRNGILKSTKDSPEMEKFKDKVKEEAIKKASDFMYNGLVNLASDLFSTAEEAVEKTRNYIKAIKKPSKEDALWVKALVNVWFNSIQSGQLLSNKPTSREEQINKNEFSFIDKITSDPELTGKLQKILSAKVDDIN